MEKEDFERKHEALSRVLMNVITWYHISSAKEASELMNLREKDGEYVEGRATLSQRKLKSWRSRYGLASKLGQIQNVPQPGGPSGN